MKLDTLETLFRDTLADIYHAEVQLTKALPKLAKAADAEQLKQAFTDHLEETENHVQRLEEVFDTLDKRPPRKVCKAMKGLIEEGGEILEADGEPSVIDAALIGAAQRVEHYEIAAYGCARTLAELLGNQTAADLLQQTLDEEAAADQKLTKIARTIVNPQAAEAQEASRPPATNRSR